MFTRISMVIVTTLAFGPNVGLAQLHFEQPAVSLGELRGGPSYSHRFAFVNESNAIIEIIDVRLGCGCLQPVIDKRSIQPGEKGVLLMNLRTLGQAAGPRSWQAHVRYRCGSATHETALTVAATLRNEITVEPSIVALTVETTLRQEITITNHRPRPLRVTAVVASAAAIRVLGTTERNGVTKIAFEVSRDDLKTQRKEETLFIETDDPDYRQMQIPITLTRAERAEVRATPERVVVTGAGSQLVRLRSTVDKVVRIERADCDDSAIRCTWAAGPGDDATLRISMDPAKMTSATVTVRVHLASPAGNVMTIPVVLRCE